MRQANQIREMYSASSRVSWCMVGVLIFGALISWKLFQKTVIEHSKYIALAKNQYITQKEIVGHRGKIFMYDPKASIKFYPLATNLEKFSISAIPRNIKDPKTFSNKLSTLLQIPENDIFDLVNNKKLYIPPIKKSVERDVADKINELDLPGILIIPEESRLYPENELGGQLVGFVNSNGDGQYGLEGYYNNELKGQSGVLTLEKDTLGRPISASDTTSAQNGSDLVLNIDHNAQFYVQSKLKEAVEKYQADSGSIIVENPKDGSIIAMSSWPDFNPNEYKNVAKENESIFLNPAISLVWEPGSVMKTISMAIGLDLKKIEPDTEGTFSNYTVVDGYEIHTAQDKAFGKETMTRCLENSDNVCLVWVADQIEKENMFNYMQKFGFNSKTGIDLTGEATGYMPQLKNWQRVNLATISFGQGISVTPLQMVSAISAIANGGKLMMPRIVSKIIKADAKEVTIDPMEVSQVISVEASSKLTQMMISVVENGHGKKAKVQGYKIAGKTGTAQIPDKENGGYYTDKHIGSFGGLFPADDPRFAMIVKLDNPKNVDWAESSAAPTFGDIANWLLNYYQIPPTEIIY